MSVGWFLIMAILSTAGFITGIHYGHGSRRRAWLTIAVSLTLMFGWQGLQQQPSWIVKAIPATLLSYLEGVAAVPLFMWIVGTLWALAKFPGQRRWAVAGLIVGILYFLSGGWWMLQTTPRQAFANGVVEGGIVMQSQDYSCVPAACATAIDMLGLTSSEAEMAQLTDTRPGSGATLIRALAGLQRRLGGTEWQPKLMQPNYRQLIGIQGPMVAPLRFELAQRHMVVIQKVTEFSVQIADPYSGPIEMDRQEFEKVYTGVVILFERR